MIIINDGKNTYGCFSKAGRKNIKKNVLLFRYEQNKIPNKNHSSSTQNVCDTKKEKKIQNPSKENDFDIFTIEDPDKENLDDIAKEIIKSHIKKINSNEENSNINNSTIKELNIKSKSKSRYYYHNHHVNKKKKKEIHLHAQNIIRSMTQF